MEFKTALGIAKQAIREKTKAVLLAGQVATANGDGSDSTVYLGTVSYKHWRVVGLGVYVLENGASTVAEIVTFGHPVCDIGAADLDAFGKLAMDITEGDNWTAGDIIITERGKYDALITPDAEANEGTSVWTLNEAAIGKLFNVWQEKAGVLSATKVNVASSTATVIPFVLLEVANGGGDY